MTTASSTDVERETSSPWRIDDLSLIVADSAGPRSIEPIDRYDVERRQPPKRPPFDAVVVMGEQDPIFHRLPAIRDYIEQALPLDGDDDDAHKCPKRDRRAKRRKRRSRRRRRRRHHKPYPTHRQRRKIIGEGDVVVYGTAKSSYDITVYISEHIVRSCLLDPSHRRHRPPIAPTPPTPTDDDDGQS